MGAKYVVYTFEFKVEQLNKFHSVKPPNDKGILCLHKVQPFEILVFQITLTLNPEKKRLDLSNVAAK